MQKMQYTWVWSLGQEDFLEEEMAIYPVFLPGKSHGKKNPVGYIPYGHKESEITERLSTHTQTFGKKDMIKILAENTSWIEENNTEKSMKQKRWVFEKINKIDKLLVKLTAV